MYLIPMPKKIVVNDGRICATAFEVDFGEFSTEGVLNAMELLRKDAVDYSSEGSIYIRAEKVTDLEKAEEYKIKIDENGIMIYAFDALGVFCAIQTLRQIVRTENGFLFCEICDSPEFEFRGLQFDTTRGRVPNMAGLKSMADICALLKINKIVLYFEHSFAFREFKDIVPEDECLHPDEIKEFVEYCNLLYIDVIPYVAMLGHQYKLLQSDKYKHLCELNDYVPTTHYWQERMLHHSFDVSNPESFELVKSFLDQLFEVFPCDIYIPGVDESWDIGKGKNEGKNVIEIYCNFVDKICAYLKEHNKTALIADDIIQTHQDGFLIKSDNTIMYHWDYEKAPNEEKYAVLSEKKLPFIAVPSTTSFNGPIERLGISRPNIVNTARLAKEHGAIGFLNTIWGDRGHWCDFNGNLFGICMGAEKAWNAETEIGEGFEESFSSLIYGEKETNIRKIIGRIAVLTYNASMYYLTHWVSDNLVSKKGTKLELIEPQTPHSDFIRRALELEEAILSLREKHPEKSDFYDSLRGACIIVHVLNVVSAALSEERRLTEEELSLVDRRFEEYHTLWLRYSKESEFYENRDFVYGIIKYLERF